MASVWHGACYRRTRTKNFEIIRINGIKGQRDEEEHLEKNDDAGVVMHRVAFSGGLPVGRDRGGFYGCLIRK